MGFGSRKPTRAPLLTARHKALRLAWGRQLRHWTVDEEKHVAWSGESRFQLNRVDGHIRLAWYGTCDTSRYDSVKEQVHKHHVSLPASIHVHCAFRRTWGTSAGAEIPQATPHTCKISTELLQEHSLEFRHFRWPPKSPDMNIIKHILDALQRDVQKRYPPPSTDLWTALQDLWCPLPPALLQTLIESMSHRVAALLCAGGGPTRYYAGLAEFEEGYNFMILNYVNWHNPEFNLLVEQMPNSCRMQRSDLYTSMNRKWSWKIMPR
ncbi:DDE_3 domain-containing protein [Trichonephila clavipes]|nr:DDE_3 domain-containing protein [Trichonephila clavipes]